MTLFDDPEQIENDILHSLIDFRGLRVLEIGCGDGRMTRHYVREAASIVGLEIDEAELAVARTDYLKEAPATLHLVQGRAEVLPFPTASFDLVLFAWSL